MRKCILCILSVLLLLTLTACSNEKLNELLFVNKIIELIELEEEVDNISSTSTNVPTPPLENNPFIADEEENNDISVSGNDTFIYLDWSTSWSDIDLDLMVLLVNSNGKAEQSNLINYNNFNYSEDIAVHMGDSVTDNECVYLNLDNILEDISKIYIYCYNYTNEWDKLSLLNFRVDSLNEKFETNINIGSNGYADYTVETATDEYGNIISTSKAPVSAVQLGVYERRGPIWYLNKEMVEIVNFNKYLSRYGISTTDYSSAYLDELARLEAEKLEQERLEAERLEQERLAAEQAAQNSVEQNSSEDASNQNTDSSAEIESNSESSDIENP